jgi:hypothetical protein
MQTETDVVIRVHREWAGWQSAEIRLRDLEDVHWYQPAGAPHALIHGFVSSAMLTSGDLSGPTNPPSTAVRTLVCVLKRHCTPTTFAELARRADRAPSRSSTSAQDARRLRVGTTRRSIVY